MPITTFKIEFQNEGKILKGDCTLIDLPGYMELPYKFPVYRVAINTFKIKPDIFIYYKVNRPGNNFIWYRHFEPKKEEKYELICKELERLTTN